MKTQRGGVMRKMHAESFSDLVRMPSGSSGAIDVMPPQKIAQKVKVL